MDIQNCQISMRILSQHATVGLQTKLEANWTKNGILALGPADPPKLARLADGYSKSPNIDAEPYSACCNSLSNQI